MATATQTETATFFSKHGSLRLVRQPRNIVPNALGINVEHSKGVVYQFDKGRLDVEAGKDLLPDGPPDETGQPTVQDGVSWLMRHPLLNADFHREGHEPDRPLPTEDVFLEAINDAAFALDEETIVQMLAQERATHNRPTLVKAADDQRKRVIRMKELAEAGD